MHFQTRYRYSVIFLCNVLDREIINYSRVHFFTNHFQKRLCESITQIFVMKIFPLKEIYFIHRSHYINLNVMRKCQGYETSHLKKQCPDAGILCVGVSPCPTVQDRTSTPCNFSVFHYILIKTTTVFVHYVKC